VGALARPAAATGGSGGDYCSSARRRWAWRARARGARCAAAHAARARPVIPRHPARRARQRAARPPRGVAAPPATRRAPPTPSPSPQAKQTAVQAAQKAIGNVYKLGRYERGGGGKRGRETGKGARACRPGCRPGSPFSSDRLTSFLLPVAFVACAFSALVPGAATMYTKPGKNS